MSFWGRGWLPHGKPAIIMRRIVAQQGEWHVGAPVAQQIAEQGAIVCVEAPGYTYRRVKRAKAHAQVPRHGQRHVAEMVRRQPVKVLWARPDEHDIPAGACHSLQLRQPSIATLFGISREGGARQRDIYTVIRQWQRAKPATQQRDTLTSRGLRQLMRQQTQHTRRRFNGINMAGAVTEAGEGRASTARTRVQHIAMRSRGARSEKIPGCSA